MSKALQLIPEPELGEVGAPPGQREVEAFAAEVVEEHPSDTTLPARKGWFLSTPVSNIATTCPAPLNPAAQALGAPIKGTLSASVGGSGRSSTLLATSAEFSMCDRPAASTSMAR